jgi:hypothetical protein
MHPLNHCFTSVNVVVTHLAIMKQLIAHATNFLLTEFLLFSVKCRRFSDIAVLGVSFCGDVCVNCLKGSLSLFLYLSRKGYIL